MLWTLPGWGARIPSGKRESVTMSRIFLSPPSIGSREYELVREALDSNYVAPVGPMVARFEQGLARYTGFASCAALSSGTAALHLALRIVGVGEGDIVVAPSLTFIGSVAPITYVGARPVFVDSAAESWLIDLELLEAALARLARRGERAKAVIAVDLYGQPCDVPALMDICERHGARLVVDAAESLGATRHGVHAGKGAPIACLSFNGNKIITTSGGGALLADDPDLVRRATYLSQQARQPVPHYEHVEIGYNYRMSNICAAIGVAQLETIQARVARRREVFALYTERLARLGCVRMMQEMEGSVGNRWLSVMTIDDDAPIAPEDVRLALEAIDIESRPVWKPMHLQPAFAGADRMGGAVCERLFARGLCLPSGDGVDADCVDRIGRVMERLLSAAGQRRRT